MALSTTTHVLRVPELLTRIFSFSTTKDNGRNLLVCKLWSNEVLNIEWKVVIEATHLYNLLAPLERPEMTEFTCFTRPLTPEDWMRFDNYAWRIRSLNLWLTPLNFDMSLYHEIATTRNRLNFLPNLCTLTIPAITTVVQLFAHTNITSFTVRTLAGENDNSEFEIKGAVLLSHIRYKMPNLQRLCIDLYALPTEMGDIRSEASLTLASLKKLSYLSLPPPWLRDRVAKTISKLPNLHTLETTSLQASDPSEEPDAPLFSTNLPAESFPKLTNLLVWISYPRAAACFSQAFWPTSLEVLELDATKPATREDLKQVIAAISGSCPRLTVLKLDDSYASFSSDDVPEGLGLRFQDLEPLTSCKYLTELHIVHDPPFLLDASDIVKLIKPLKCLTDLHLNAMPHIQSPSPLPISCLSSIVSARPSLHSLGLYVSTSSADVPRADPMATFKSLKVLHFGYSTLAKNDVAPVAFYLGHILPRNCEIFSFKPSFPQPLVQGPPPTDQWGKVSGLARMFRQAVDNGEKHVLSESIEK
ncbi:hypothetical protein ONZ45_g8212 [Pleurotus djamor]|nr:hypothetical protein ONZ45_g8212 [Pleurotus djamor]